MPNLTTIVPQCLSLLASLIIDVKIGRYKDV